MAILCDQVAMFAWVSRYTLEGVTLLVIGLSTLLVLVHILLISTRYSVIVSARSVVGNMRVLIAQSVRLFIFEGSL